MVCEQYARIIATMARAAERAGRDPQTVRLVAISKQVPVERIRAAIACGQTVFGENYLQEAAAKINLARAVTGRREDGYHLLDSLVTFTEYGDRIAPTAGEDVSFEYFVLAETFKGEVCQGFDHLAVCKVLEAHGCIVVKEPGRYTTKTRLPGIGNVRCYHLAPSLFELDL